MFVRARAASMCGDANSGEFWDAHTLDAEGLCTPDFPSSFVFFWFKAPSCQVYLGHSGNI